MSNIFIEIEKKILNSYGTTNSSIVNAILKKKKKEQSWTHHTSWFLTILQSYSSAITKTEYKPRNKLIHIWLIFNKGDKYIQWGKNSGVGEIGYRYLHAKELKWIPISHCTQKSAQIGLRLEYMTWNHKSPRRQHKG